MRTSPAAVNPEEVDRVSEAGPWDDATFVGGHVALDFVNTAGGSTRARDVERLVDWPTVLAWGRAAGLLGEPEVATLHAADPEESAAALRDLRVQRESLHAFLVAGTDGVACSPGDRDRVHADVADAYASARPSEQYAAGPAWVVDDVEFGPSAVRVRLGLATAALLADERRAQIRCCGRCSWLFLDPSPTRRRRWCSMATCGNRAKAARHHERRTG